MVALGGKGGPKLTVAWEAAFHENEHLVAVKLTGRLSLSEVQALNTHVRGLLEHHGVTSILADITQAENGLSTGDILRLPTAFSTLQFPSRTRTALVLGLRPDVHPKLLQDCVFFLDVAFNRGWTIKAFETRPAALNWLQTAGTRNGYSHGQIH